MIRLVTLSLAAAGLAAAVAAAEARSDAPLRLVEPGAPLAVPEASSPRRGGAPPAEREWLLQNVSDAPIAAWNYACVSGGRDGRGGWTGSGRDGFGSARSGSGLLQPGEADVVSLPEPPLRESPFEVWSCGVSAVVFADGRTWGSPEVLDRVFERRVAQAREARRLLGAIERLQPAGATRLLDARRVVAVLEAALPEDRVGTYRGRVAGLESAAGDELAERLAALAVEARSDLDAMLPQLRPQDLRHVEADTVPPPPPPPMQRGAVLLALGDGRPELTSAEEGVLFDLDGGGDAERIAWPRGGAEAAFLALDRDQSGGIESGLELFGDASPQVPSAERSGFRALAPFDEPHNGGDGDGWIGPGDEVFAWLLLWRDANHDGVSQPDELTPAGEEGLEGIDLADRPSTRRAEYGDRVRQTTTTRWRDGAARPAWHVVLAVPPAP